MDKYDPNPKSTADWRKYPKSPNFLGIVIGAAIVVLILMVLGWFLIRKEGLKMIPHGPNPTPNALYVPHGPDRAPVSNA